MASAIKVAIAHIEDISQSQVFSKNIKEPVLKNLTRTPTCSFATIRAPSCIGERRYSAAWLFASAELALLDNFFILPAMCKTRLMPFDNSLFGFL